MVIAALSLYLLSGVCIEISNKCQSRKLAKGFSTFACLFCIASLILAMKGILHL